MTTSHRIEIFRRLHAGPDLLILANAWDAGSAKAIESRGAKALATTSAGLAWSRGYPDGDALPPDQLVAAVGDILRVTGLPVTIDIEGGYADDPKRVAALALRLEEAGTAGINIEDGGGEPALLARKIEAARRSALFINARTDVYLQKLVAPERAADEVIRRGSLYASAGADGIFVPMLSKPADIERIAGAIGNLPLNVMAVPGLPKGAELGRLGVRRLSAGAAIAQAALGLASRLAAAFLETGDCDPLFAEGAIDYMEINAALAQRT